MKQLKSINESKVEHYEFPGLASFSCRQDLEFGQIKTEFRKKAFLLVRSNGSRHLILFQGQQLPEDHVRRSSKLKMQLWNTWWTLDLNLNYIFFPFDSIFKCIESPERTWVRSDEILKKSSVFTFHFSLKRKIGTFVPFMTIFQYQSFLHISERLPFQKYTKKVGRLGNLIRYNSIKMCP